MSSQMIAFPTPADKQTQETGAVFAPKFDSDGLISAIICDANSGEVLMLGYMNAETLKLSLETKECHYWSRSRQEIWHKGATSGNVQKIREIRTDCDQDALVIKVDVTGAEATCHTGRTSCFYRTVEMSGNGSPLTIIDEEIKFDPEKIYGNS